jgi:hypothetical protein
MTTQDVADAVLKTLYEGEGAHEQMRDFNPTLKLFEPTSDHIEGGRTINFPLQQQYQQGIGARSETQDLPIPGKSNYVGCNFPLMKLCFSVQITTSAWKKTKQKGVGAFVDLLSEQGADVLGGHYRDLNMQLHMAGVGLRGTLNGAVLAGQNVTIVMFDVRWMMEGMLIDIYPAGTAAATTSGNPVGVPIQQNVAVTSVLPLLLEITVDELDQNLASGVEIFRAGDLGQEITGLQGFVNNSTGPANIQGLSSVTFPTWNSNVLANGGTARDLSRNLVDLAMRASLGVDQRRFDVAICGLVQARKYAQLMTIKDEYEKSDKGGKITLDAGYEYLKIFNKALIEDPDCLDDRIYFLRSKGVLKIWQLGKPEFVYSPDAKHMWYRLEGKPFFRADGEYFCQFGGYRRNNQTVLEDLNTVG